MGDVLKKVPVREQAPKVRATNFDEVCLGVVQFMSVTQVFEVLTPVALILGMGIGLFGSVITIRKHLRV